MEKQLKSSFGLTFYLFLYLPLTHFVAVDAVCRKIMKNEYLELRKQCQDFATALLDHTRSSHELEVLLNHDPTGPAFEHGERMHLNRLKLAVKLRQKKVSSNFLDYRAILKRKHCNNFKLCNGSFKNDFLKLFSS